MSRSTKFTFVFLAFVCVGEAMGKFELNYFDILGDSKVANFTKEFENVSLIECAAKCTTYEHQGSCMLAGYDKKLRTCQISQNNVILSSPGSNFTVLKIAESLDCGIPASTSKMNFSVEGTAVNDEAILICEAGFVPTASSIKCLPNEQWEHASCVKDCGTSIETHYINIAATYPSGSLEGAAATATCTPGHRSESGLSSWTFLCDNFLERWTTAQDPDCIWELMFRGTAENGYNVTNAFLFGLASDGVTNEEGCMDVYNTSCSLNYRNPKVDQWNGLPIAEVVYELYDSARSVLVVKFNGTDSSINSWFSTSSVTSYPWTIDDLGATWWDLNGPSDIETGRSFRMTAGYYIEDEICADHYYTVVFFPPGWTCVYDDFSNYPKFTYSVLTNGSLYQTEPFETARAMGIWVKYN